MLSAPPGFARMENAGDARLLAPIKRLLEFFGRMSHFVTAQTQSADSIAVMFDDLLCCHHPDFGLALRAAISTMRFIVTPSICSAHRRARFRAVNWSSNEMPQC